ncbi:MAG: RluA family pseudouridine synthase, partial [Bacteroidota bacterium]
RIQQAARSGSIRVNDQPVKPNYKVRPNDVISVVMPYPREKIEVLPEPVPLNIVFEDDDLLVLHKPAGLVVHPGHGNFNGTLVNGLLHYLDNLPNASEEHQRPGLVHRLDKDTTGLMVIAKSEGALSHLAKQFFDRTIHRSYLALVWGEPQETEGTITGHIGRSRKNRKVMDVYPEGEQGKPAVTHYEVVERFGYVTLVRCRLETGRTHQIRVHMKYIGHPLFGDANYGGDRILKGTTFTKYRQFIANCFKLLPRQALHAQTLGFVHPQRGDDMHFEADLPEDMQAVLEKWRGYSRNSQLG